MASFLKSWALRTLIVAALAAAGYGAWFAYSWVSPEKVRATVEGQLREKLAENVEVHVGSAHLKLFGGISITDLTLTTRGESEPFLKVPAATITHDKEQLNRGELVVRKVEVDDATIRVDRRADGTWSLAGVAKPGGGTDKLLPAVMFRNATVIVTDQRPDGLPAVALRNVTGSLLNESLPVLKWEGSCDVMAAQAVDDAGQPDPTALRVHVNSAVRWNKATKQLNARIDVPSLDVSPDLAALLCRGCPQAAAYAPQLQCKTAIKAEFAAKLDTPGATQYDVRFDLKDGRFEDPVLPWPLERVAGGIRIQDGRLTVEKLGGKLGHATVELSLESKADLLAARKPAEPTIPGPRVRPPAMSGLLRGPLLCYPEYDCQDPLRSAEDRLERFELTVGGLSLDDELFARLTPKLERIRSMFSPQGGVDVGVKFQRTSDGGWRREVDLRPNRLKIEYEKFRYPVTDLAGSLKKVTASDGTDEYRVDVTGTAGGRRVTLKGKVAGDGPDPHIALKIAGTDVPIDDKLVAALPAKYAASIGKLHAKARGNFVVDVRQSYGVNSCENTFLVDVYNGTVRYDHFPYPFTQVRGGVKVVVTAADPARPLRPGLPLGPEPDTDKVELRGFEAAHDGGRMWLSGDNECVYGSSDRKLTVKVQGENWPLDDDFRASLRELKLDAALGRFAPRGELTFGAEITLWDRSGRSPGPSAVPANLPVVGETVPAAAKLPAEPPFDPANDLKLALNFKGPSITPAFFPYDLHQLEGRLWYQNGQVILEKFAARHGPSAFTLEAAKVLFHEGGGVWASFGDIGVAPFVPDAAFLKALPGKLKTGFEELNLRGPAELTLKHLVVDMPTARPAVARGQAAGPAGTAGLGQAVARGQAPDPPTDRWEALPTSAAATTRPYESVPPGVHLDAPAPAVRFQPAAPTVPLNPVPAATAVPKDKEPAAKAPSRTLPFTLPWQKTPPAPAPAAPPKFFPDAEPPDPVVYWNAELKMTGAALDAGLPWDDVYGTLASEGRYEGTALGSVVGNAWFEKATVAKMPVTTGKFSYRVRPQEADPAKAGAFLPPVVEFPELQAKLFGGMLGGQARVVLAESVRYRVYLTAAEVRLDDFARHQRLGSGSELRGLAQGAVLVENLPEGKNGKLITSGSGHVDVPQGRMYNLPVLLELVKLLKGQTPDGVAFEEAHAVFDLKGDRIKVTQLDLLGSAVSLGGAGELDTAGQYVKFEFYTIWSQTLKRWLSTPLGDVTSLLSGSLFKIELSRENGKLTPKAHMLPVVTDPVRAVAERLRARAGRTQDAAKQ